MLERKERKPQKKMCVNYTIDTYFSWMNLPDAKYVIDFTG